MTLPWWAGLGGVQESPRYYPACELCNEDLTGDSFQTALDAENAFEEHMLYTHDMKLHNGTWRRLSS